VKALACELPAERGVPLSRWSSAEIAREAVTRGIVAQISGATVWRWLSEDAIRPWSYRSWIFPRDPDFRAKAGRVLDLYEGRWHGRLHGRLLEPGDFVVCADEKPSIQARRRKHASVPAAPGGVLLVEHEYERMGALCYLAAWDVRHAKIFDRCAPKDGIEPFDALVEQFMSVEPYASARRVFVVVDNGSAHRGKRSIDRLQGAWPNLILVHTPIHASWLNQAEIYLSVVQRKVLQPNDFADLESLEQQLLAFRADRETLPMEVHPPRPQPATRPTRPAQHHHADPARSMTCRQQQPRPNVKKLTSQTLSSGLPGSDARGASRRRQDAAVSVLPPDAHARGSFWSTSSITPARLGCATFSDSTTILSPA
jgi:DDE superfamily endonuclease